MPTLTGDGQTASTSAAPWTPRGVQGDLIPDALLARFAPLGWQHLNLTGNYLWGADASLGPDGFRPLRGAAASLPMAAAA